VLSRASGLAPVAVAGGAHRGGRFELAVASAQVKSALLLAALTAQGSVTVREPVLSRDHTERLLRAMGAHVAAGPEGVAVEPGPINNIAIRVPGDPSSAAFWCAAAALSDARSVTIRHMLFNPARTGFFRLLEAMGCQVSWDQEGIVPEPYGAVTVRGGALSPFKLDAEDIPAMVDEVPLAALLATQAGGISEIRGAHELRIKECDRIRVTTEILGAMGASIQEVSDGWIIAGPTALKGAVANAHGDHRMAMLAAIAASIATGPSAISDGDSVAISYPQFFDTYAGLARLAG
jgi:3-phosphoshikimate 1-carboxyvinyltransferase